MVHFLVLETLIARFAQDGTGAPAVYFTVLQENRAAPKTSNSTEDFDSFLRLYLLGLIAEEDILIRHLLEVVVTPCIDVSQESFANRVLETHRNGLYELLAIL